MTVRQYNDAELAAEVVAGGWTGADRLVAFQVALAESNGDCDALNRNMLNATTIRSIDHGLWQINSIHSYRPGFDQVWATRKYGGSPGNAKLAYAIFREIGWNAWLSYKNRATNPRWAEFVERSQIAFSDHAPIPYPLNPQTSVFGSASWGGTWKGYTVFSGSTGFNNEIKAVQKNLGATQTGQFDNATVAKLKVFQAANGLEAHGVLGPTGWAALKLTT